MKFFVTAIINFCTSLIGSLMGPISSTILSFLPQLTGFDQAVEDFFTWVVHFANWALSWLPFSTSFWTIFVLYWVFRLSAPLLVHAIKTAVKWWHALVP